MLEKKIYTEWAFSSQREEMRDINVEIYNELRPLAKVCWWDSRTRSYNYTEEDKQKYVCFEKQRQGYAEQKYIIHSNPHNLSSDELALICDNGNLCFGYRRLGNEITIYTD